MGKKGRNPKAGKNAHKRWQLELIESLPSKQTFQIEDLFWEKKNNTNTNNCYVLFRSNHSHKVGFKYNDKTFILSDHKKSSIISISCSQNLSLTLTAFVTKPSIVKYGINDTNVAQEIEFRISLLNHFFNSEKDYIRFFEFLSQNRENDLVAPYFKMLFSADKSDYKETLSVVVKNTLKYFKNPELLITPNNNNNTPVQTIPINHTQKYPFNEYRETKGIYYTLSNESIVLSDDYAVEFNIKYLKRFAYVAGNSLSKYFSFLIVIIDPMKQNLCFRYHNGKWNEITISITIDGYIAKIEKSLSGISKIMWNISVQIAKKLFITEAHHETSYKSNGYVNGDRINTNHINKNDTAILKPSISHQAINNSNTIIISHLDLDKELTKRKMHYRRGHWHYYWYGAYNSTERHKELKWVEETIVNRDSMNIVIVI